MNISNHEFVSRMVFRITLVGCIQCLLIYLHIISFDEFFGIVFLGLFTLINIIIEITRLLIAVVGSEPQ
jgi:hypothetical protein